MTEYCDDKAELVQYVSDMLETSILKWPWIMTIHPDTLEGYCVHIAIGASSEDTVENTQNYLKQLTNTS